MNANEAYKAYLESLRAIRCLQSGTQIVIRAPEGDATIAVGDEIRAALLPILRHLADIDKIVLDDELKKVAVAALEKPPASQEPILTRRASETPQAK